MAISSVVTRGFDTGSGSGGSANLVVTRGYGVGSPAPPAPTTVSGGGGGGRRKWDEVFPRRKRRKPHDSRPLTRAEISDLDAIFAERGEPSLSDLPAIVRAEPAVREAARALLLPHGPLSEKPTLELVHGSPLKAEVRDVGPVSSLQARLTAQRAEQKLVARQEQLAREQEQRDAEAIEALLAAIAEVERVEAARLAYVAEQERLEAERIAADEAEMFDILMLVHEDVI